eukprot:6407262-Prymnesium_polylepis.1
MVRRSYTRGSRRSGGGSRPATAVRSGARRGRQGVGAATGVGTELRPPPAPGPARGRSDALSDSPPGNCNH